MFGIELEFNPFSTASRAARAERAGRVGQALALYVKVEQYDRVRDCLRTSLPAGAARDVLLGAASEWLQLRSSIDAANGHGLPEGWTSWYDDELRKAESALWRSADCIAAALRHHVDSPRLRAGLDREIGKVSQLSQAFREARASLAELSLAGGGVSPDLEEPERRLKRLVQAARELEEETNAAKA